MSSLSVLERSERLRALGDVDHAASVLESDLLSAVLESPSRVSRLIDELTDQGAAPGGVARAARRSGLFESLTGPVPCGHWPPLTEWEDPSDAEIDAYLVGGLIFHRRRGDMVEAGAFAASLRARVDHVVSPLPSEVEACTRGELALTEVLAGRFSEGAREAERALRVAGRAGRGVRKHLLALQALALAVDGRLVAASDVIARAEKVSHVAGWMAGIDAERLLLARSVLAVERADPGAGRLLARLRDDVLDELWPLALLARVRHHLARGEVMAASRIVDDPVPADRMLLPGTLAWHVVRSQRLAVRNAGGLEPEGDGIPLEEAGESTLSMSALLSSDPPPRGAVALAERVLEEREIGPAARAKLLLLVAGARRGGRALGAIVEAADIVERERLERVRACHLDEMSRARTRVHTRRTRTAPAPEAVSITTRERVVISRMAAGDTVAEAAVELGVSLNTVKTQLKSIYRRLGVASRTEAVAEAARRGIIE